ncbi:MAG TPA: Uma2 family endonuclease [Pirellulaceae bacterium]
MTWQDVCDEPTLQNLPFKIELNRFGKIVMSPASNWHGILQMRIGARLMQAMDSGEVISECSVETSDRTKVADIAWASAAFMERHGRSTPYAAAPAICVEILSPSNSEEEMRLKRALYFEAGAEEVWECDDDGVIAFYGPSGSTETSSLAPAFPKRV